MLTSTCISTLCCFAGGQLSRLFIRTGQLHCYSSEVMGVYSLDFTLNGLSEQVEYTESRKTAREMNMQGKSETKTL